MKFANFLIFIHPFILIYIHTMESNKTINNIRKTKRTNTNNQIRHVKDLTNNYVDIKSNLNNIKNGLFTLSKGMVDVISKIY